MTKTTKKGSMKPQIQKQIEEAVKEFHQKYDFSEGKTLEYDNLVGIADFIKEKLETIATKSAELERERERIAEEVKNRKATDKALRVLDQAETEQWFDMLNTTENWKTWKRIRNTIVDLNQEAQSSEEQS